MDDQPLLSPEDPLPENNKFRQAKFFVLIAVLLLAMVLVGLLAWPRSPTEASVLADFHAATGRAEDMLMDPLILHANLIKARIIRDIADSAMDKRRYAIHFLGNNRVPEAIPTLRKILDDKTERDYFRADALESIFMIEPELGRELAGIHAADGDLLGTIARGLLDGSHQPWVRSMADAVGGHHY